MSPKRPPTKVRAPKVVRTKRGWRVALGAVSHRLGHRSEWLAAALLMAKGYQVLGFRLKTRAGEIDILARRGKVLAVVEVKRRATLEAALTALGPDQYDRLLSAGRSVLRQRPESIWWRWLPAGFRAIVAGLSPSGGAPHDPR